MPPNVQHISLLALGLGAQGVEFGLGVRVYGFESTVQAHGFRIKA